MLCNKIFIFKDHYASYVNLVLLVEAALSLNNYFFLKRLFIITFYLLKEPSLKYSIILTSRVFSYAPCLILLMQKLTIGTFKVRGKTVFNV